MEAFTAERSKEQKDEGPELGLHFLPCSTTLPVVLSPSVPSLLSLWPGSLDGNRSDP